MDRGTDLGLLHGRHATPHFGVWIMAVVSAVIGAFGVLSVLNLTAITFLSNFGTFLLYSLANLIAWVAFRRTPKAHTVTHVAVPLLGIIANVAMLLAVIYLGILGGGDTKTAALIAILATAAWFAIVAVYFVMNTRGRSRHVWAVKPT